jgi:hypothetical protein
VTAEGVKMDCTKQEVVTESGLHTRVEREVYNATTCMDMAVMVVLKAFSTMTFSFKITSRQTATQSIERINPFVVMRQAQTRFISLPPRLGYARMYAGHVDYNTLIDFLEDNRLGWTCDTALTVGKRFVDGMSRAFFESNSST